MLQRSYKSDQKPDLYENRPSDSAFCTFISSRESNTECV